MNGRLRVLFLATYFPKPGNEQMGSWALSQAKALARNGVELEVISLTSWVPKMLSRFGRAKVWSACPQEVRWGDVLVRYPRWPLYQAGRVKRFDYARPWLQHTIAWHTAKWRLRRIIRRFKPDVIYAHHTWVGGDVARRIKAEFGIPFVITDHDYDEINDCLKLPARREYFGKVMAAAGMAAPVSNDMAESIRRIWPGTKTAVAHNGTDPIAPALREAGLSRKRDGQIVVFCAAGFYTRKNIPLLVRAFARVAANHPTAVLRIAGGGHDGPAVEQAIRDAAFGDRIMLLGMISHDRVLEELVACDLFALIGRDEPFATVYLEAFSAGKPVLCCSDGGINDVLVSGVHGLSIPPSDEDAAVAGLDQLLADPARLKAMGDAASTLFEMKLTTDRRAQALIEMLNDVVRQHKLD